MMIGWQTLKIYSLESEFGTEKMNQTMTNDESMSMQTVQGL